MKGKKQEDVQVGFGDLVLMASNLAASHLRPVQRALHPSKPQSQATSMKHQGLAESAKKSLCFPSSPFFVPRPSCSLDVCATWLPHPLPGPTKRTWRPTVLNKTDPWALETPLTLVNKWLRKWPPFGTQQYFSTNSIAHALPGSWLNDIVHCQFEDDVFQ